MSHTEIMNRFGFNVELACCCKLSLLSPNVLGILTMPALDATDFKTFHPHTTWFFNIKSSCKIGWHKRHREVYGEVTPEVVFRFVIFFICFATGSDVRLPAPPRLQSFYPPVFEHNIRSRSVESMLNSIL